MKSSCIFLVDDDCATLESFKLILEHEGYEIFTATNGLELQDLLLTQAPSLILMDYNLGEDNGGELMQGIKKNPETSHIPVIIISANTHLRTSSTLENADGFIEKPIEIPLLLSTVAKQITHE